LSASAPSAAPTPTPGQAFRALWRSERPVAASCTFVAAVALLSYLFKSPDVALRRGRRYVGNSATPRRRRVVTGVVAALAAPDPVLVRYGRQDMIEPFDPRKTWLQAARALGDWGAHPLWAASGRAG